MQHVCMGTFESQRVARKRICHNSCSGGIVMVASMVDSLSKIGQNNLSFTNVR